MRTLLASLVILIASSQAFANLTLANNGKVVVCYADDNQSWVINAKRTTIKYTVEGETLGPQKIVETKSNKNTFVSYLTSEGTLTLSNKGDFYQFDGDEEAGEIECK